MTIKFVDFFYSREVGLCLREASFDGGCIIGLAVQKGTDTEHWRDENRRGQVDVFGARTYFSATFFIIKLRGAVLGSNTDLRGEKSATKKVSLRQPWK
jgi:hypothetical protein